MARKKRRSELDVDPSEVFQKKENDAHRKYQDKVWFGGDKDARRRYENYTKEHAKRLRRLEREARGELVPGDYDESY